MTGGVHEGVCDAGIGTLHWQIMVVSSRVPFVIPYLALACSDPDAPLHARDLPPPEPTIRATGEVRWTAVFDADAKAAGAVDCSYIRTYTATEDRSTPWLCPDCDVVLRAGISMSEADRACYAAVAGTTPAPVERIGWDDTRLLRAGAEFAPLGELALLGDPGDGDTLGFSAQAQVLPAPVGTVSLAIAGELETSTVLGDPRGGMSPPPTYRCGWPVRDPPTYTGPWTVEIGAQVPDGWFRDACDEPVRLHDLVGRYVVIDLAAADCGPCQQMAEEEAAFVAQLRERGIEVEVVTLLATSLSDPLAPADLALRDAWSDTFALSTVVVGDRGWGWAMARELWPESLAYPSWFVLSPGFEVLAVGRGYAGWGEMTDVIIAHGSR